MVFRESVRFRSETIEFLEPRVVPATLIVSSAADAGPGTLRQAILDANATYATDVIRIEGIETIALLSALPDIMERVYIEGNGATLDGSAITEMSNGIVLRGNASDSEIYDLNVTHFPGHGFVLGDFWFGYIEGCSAVENGRGNGGAGFWVRDSLTVLRDVQAIGNGGPGILFDNEEASSGIQQCLVDGAYTRDNAGPEVRVVDLERSGIVNSTFVHGDGAAIVVNSNASYGIAFDGNTYIGNADVPIDLGNNGRSPHDAPSQSMGYLGPDGWADAPVLTEFKTLGDVSYVRGFVRSGYHTDVEVSLYTEQVVDGQVVRFEIDRFTVDSDDNGLASFVRILPGGAGNAESSLRATRLDEYFSSQTSEMSDAVTATVGDPSPLQIVNPKKVVFTDWDGNRVTVTTTKGAFRADHFDLVPDQYGYHLAALRLDSTFEGAKLRFDVKHSPTGDGRIFVGEVHAEGVNLHSLSVEGNLQELSVGRNDGSVSIKKLSVITLGYGYYPIFRNAFAGDSAIVAQGSIRDIVCDQSMENTAIISLGGNIGRVDAGSITDSLILAHNIGTVEAFLSISGTTIRAETGSIGRVQARGMGSPTYGHGSEIFARTTIGSIVSGTIAHTRIVAHADPAADLGPSPQAIGSITVKGSMVNTQILAGVPLDPLNPEDGIGIGNAGARIGTVRVSRDWVDSDLAAGIAAGADEQYGTADDTFLPSGVASNTPAIARLVIGGNWMAEEDGIHAVIARRLGTVQINGSKLSLPTGPFNQTVATAERDTGEMRLVQR